MEKTQLHYFMFMVIGSEDFVPGTRSASPSEYDLCYVYSNLKLGAFRRTSFNALEGGGIIEQVVWLSPIVIPLICLQWLREGLHFQMFQRKVVIPFCSASNICASQYRNTKYTHSHSNPKNNKWIYLYRFHRGSHCCRHRQQTHLFLIPWSKQKNLKKFKKVK